MEQILDVHCTASLLYGDLSSWHLDPRSVAQVIPWMIDHVFRNEIFKYLIMFALIRLCLCVCIDWFFIVHSDRANQTLMWVRVHMEDPKSVIIVQTDALALNDTRTSTGSVLQLDMLSSEIEPRLLMVLISFYLIRWYFFKKPTKARTIAWYFHGW